MEEILCRFCLKVSTEDSVGLENAERNMMQVLVPDIKLDIVDDPKMCVKCLEKLHISYGFKASFLGSNKIPNKVFSEDFDNAIEKSCVFCNAQVYEELDEEESIKFKEVVNKCFPDVDYLGQSCTCGSCFNTLKDLYAFTKKCLETEVLISKFGKCNLKVSLSKIKLNISPKLEISELVSNVPSEVTDAAEHCVSMKEIKAIIGNGKIETQQEERLDEEQSPNTKNQGDICTAQETSTPNGQKCKVPTFSCEECNYVSKHRSALLSHKLRHKNPSEVNMFKCTECDHETKRRADLRAHMKIHMDPKQLPLFHCANCSYFSKRKCDLKQHVLVHMKPIFKCKHCSYATNNELYLKNVHVLIHKDVVSEADILVCDLCPYQTIYKLYLTRHMKRQHTNHRVTYKCNWCDFSTLHRLSLRQHLMLHKSKSERETFKCYACEYESIRKRALKIHIFNIHKQMPREMLYCAHCKFKSVNKNSLKKHLPLHRHFSDVTTYSCDICDYKSRRKGSIKLHKISHMRNKINQSKKMDIQFNTLDMELAD